MLKVPAGYGAHFRSDRRRATEILGREQRRRELVRRIQRADRIVVAFVRPLLLFPDRVSRPIASSAVCPQALKECGYQDIFALSRSGAFMSARRVSQDDRHREFLRRQGARHQPDRAGRLLLQRRSRDHRSASAANAPMFMFVYLAANHYPWTDRWRPGVASDMA